MKFIQRKVQHCSSSSPFVIKECLKGRIEISPLFAVGDVVSNALTTAGIDETTTRWTGKIFNFPKPVECAWKCSTIHQEPHWPQ